MRITGFIVAAALALALGGCGLFYQAGSGYRAHRMSDNLKTGESTLDVHRQFGEPDIRSYPNSHTEVWSYAIHANSNDLTATLLYTAAKPGDKGTFLDLEFVDGKLVSWSKATHTMPAKEGAGFSAGIGAPPIAGSTHRY